MRRARVRGAALRIGAGSLFIATLTVASGAQASLEAVVRRDLLLATPSNSQPGEFVLRLWASSGSESAFVARQGVVSADGVLTHLDRNDAVGGDYFASADLVPAGLAGSVIYNFVSPFTRTARMNHLPLRTRYVVAAPELITDFEYDPPNGADPGRSDSLVVVGRDTVTGSHWLRRVPLSGASITRVAFGGGAQALSLAIDPVRGDIHVVDDLGMLHSFTASLGLVSFNLLTPAVSCHDLVWHAARGRAARLLAPGRSATVAREAIFALAPGAAPTAVVEAHLPGPASALVVDAAADAYCLIDAVSGGREVWLWDSKAGGLIRTNIPTGPYQAIAWTSRCSVELIAREPGTPVPVDLVPPRVGDAGLTFTVTAPAGVTLEPMGLLLSSRWTEQPYGLGRNARLVVDPTAPGFVFVPLPGARPPTVFVPRPLVAGYDGARVVAQFIWVDAATKEWLTSWAANFVIGQ